MKSKNKILDAVMGLCVADALGVPVEFITREEIMRNPVTEMRGYGTYNMPPGTWSDDTSMTLCLLDSLSEGLDYHDIMSKFQKWMTRAEYTPHGEVFDVGVSTRQAICRFIEGTEPLRCGGEGEHDNGNGSLMRILPLLFYIQYEYGMDFYEKDKVFDIIHDVSSLTHAHKRSKIACGLYLCVANQIVAGMERNQAVSAGIRRAAEHYICRQGYEEELFSYRRILESGFEKTPEIEIRSSGYVVHTLEAALWCFLNTDSYRDCVLKAVNLGEDTDTVAAVAGGIAGLYYGYDNIPEEWLRQIAKREYIEELCRKKFN